MPPAPSGPARVPAEERTLSTTSRSRRRGTASGALVSWREKVLISLPLLAGIYVLILLVGLPRGHLNTGDTNLLVSGTSTALECLRQGVLQACGVADAAADTPIGPYPLLQYIPAAVATLLGLGPDQVLRLLGLLNVLAFAACLVLPVVALEAVRRPEQRRRAAVAVVAVVASSAAYQATAGFGEMLAAAAIVFAVTAARRGWLAWLAPAVLVASLSKETAAPVVVVLCLAVAARGRLVPPRGVLIRIVAGALAGLALSALFNVFRFGSPRNANYLDPSFRTEQDYLASFALGEWLSPTAGVALFWPVATAVLLVGLVLAVRRAGWRTAEARNASWVLVSVLAVVGATTALALWYSPFGWITFGPRLAVPLLPAGVLAVVAGLPRTGWSAKLRRIPVAARVTAGLLACVSAWVFGGATWYSSEAIQALIAKGPGCPVMTEVIIQKDRDEYFRCTQQFMWRTDGAVYSQAATGGGVEALPGRATSALLAAALCGVALSSGGPRVPANRR